MNERNRQTGSPYYCQQLTNWGSLKLGKKQFFLSAVSSAVSTGPVLSQET